MLNVFMRRSYLKKSVSQLQLPTYLLRDNYLYTLIISLKVNMEAKLVLIVILFPCLWFVDGCNRNVTINCSGHATCHYHKAARSLDNNEKEQKDKYYWKRTYSITLQGDPCNFNTYDKNGDGAITKEEMHATLCSNVETDVLFADLDISAVDGEIKPEEFFGMAPLIITDCFNSTLPKYTN
ncbi:uncharacterized protein LOC123543960 [Mercenaria mercenaria]|uniref:uncharacterized protein LOC123543960 n=1 Tax=Mercenaria mercenaria TaxID=6596 RepID=UPI00234F5F77|nr:uncharacterized protein LOC123543960 [Mercenaria mercenaria]